ncbi:MAG: hypothetical protein KJ923_05875 [Candidatus Omnitrophica bacterium]|nr:hypothetical protein [Candidatus Omnitrophota bacterium]
MFLKAFSYLNSKDFTRIKTQYPHLNKPTDKLRVVVLFAGGPYFDLMTEPLPLDTIPGINRPIKTYEFSLITGYRITQDLKRQDRGGLTILNADMIYIGPVRRQGDVTLIGTWTSYHQLVEQRLALMLVDPHLQLRKLYEKFTIERVKNLLINELFRGKYDLDNIEKQQMLSFTGIMIFSFDNEETYPEFISFIENIRKQVSEIGECGVLPKLVFAQDILVPLIMMSQGENIYTYLATREYFISETCREFYLRLYDFYRLWHERTGNLFDLWVFAPYHHESVFLRWTEKRSLDITQKLPLKIISSLNSSGSPVEGDPVAEIKTIDAAKIAEVTLKLAKEGILQNIEPAISIILQQC